MKSQAILLTFTLSIAASNAALVVYEGFDYTAGTNTASAANGSSSATTAGVTATGTGLTGSWIMNRGGSGNNVSGTSFTSPTLDFGDLSETGIKLAWTGYGSSAAGNQLTADLTSSASSALAPGATNKTIWMSTLIRPGTFANGSGVFLGNNAVAGDTSGATIFGLGFNSAGNAVVSYNNGSTAATTGTFSATSTYWLVGNMTYSISGGTTTFSAANLWIYSAASGNPPVDELALGAAMASFSGTSTSTGSRVPDNLLFKTGSSLANSQFDEVRIGDSYASVAAIPEPRAALLGGLGLLALLRRRRA